MSKPLQGQEMWEDTWAHLQKTEADLTVSRVPAHGHLHLQVIEK